MGLDKYNRSTTATFKLTRRCLMTARHAGSAWRMLNHAVGTIVVALQPLPIARVYYFTDVPVTSADEQAGCGLNDYAALSRRLSGAETREQNNLI